MKKFTFLLLLVCTASLSFAVNKYELLIGIRAGGGAMYYADRYTGTIATNNFTYKSFGGTIPAKAEILLGRKGLRIGYRFDYMHGIFQNYKYDYNDGNIPDVKGNIHELRNIYTHLFVLEYAAAIKQHFAITPAFAIGGYRGYLVDNDANGTKYYFKDYLTHRLVINAGVGFEFSKKRFSFVLAPTYGYYNYKESNPSGIYTSQHGAFHSFTLDLVFRLNLLKPRVYYYHIVE